MRLVTNSDLFPERKIENTNSLKLSKRCTKDDQAKNYHQGQIEANGKINLVAPSLRLFAVPCLKKKKKSIYF